MYPCYWHPTWSDDPHDEAARMEDDMRTYPPASWSLGWSEPRSMTYQEVATYAANLIRKSGPDQHFIIWWAVYDCAFYSYGRATYDPDKNSDGHAAYIAAAMRNATDDWYTAHPERQRPTPEGAPHA